MVMIRRAYVGESTLPEAVREDIVCRVEVETFLNFGVGCKKDVSPSSQVYEKVQETDHPNRSVFCRRAKGYYCSKTS